MWRTLPLIFAIAACGQESTSEIRIKFDLGQRLGQDLEQRDGRLDAPAVVSYVQGIAKRLGQGVATEVRITRSAEVYANRLPNGVLYLSGGLFKRLENEAELAGLLAHAIAHSPQSLQTCVLASPLGMPRSGAAQDGELQATSAAIANLKSAGYEPSALLDLLSKLAFEHPVFARAIVPEDLLALRIALEKDAPPVAGYVLDSSQFLRHHAAAGAGLGPTPALSVSAVR